ncbi:hypothetical protein G8759_04190 [Spirosoma aureum]|uniref:Pr6Pr family membrane protein n=1 Tax=Spirosoma aureum TaxID=2692134 RepID=A0A6G9AHE2_9BACT|nr:Pr6Pr family membrane protein [Spirosoma aureum]QIP11887.1 hypothetical protein G8759_04190 [Spirosoma aureum]
MNDQYTANRQVFVAIGALMGWLAVGLQLYLIILNRVMSIPLTIVQFFSFFTILTNILVALCFTFLWLRPQSDRGIFFSSPQTSTAIAVYIVIVGLVYNLILRQLWAPQGLQRVVDEALHSVMPIYFAFYWFIFVPKEKLAWANVPVWLLYPLGYIVYILIRGEFSGLYPYPFIDVSKLGYAQVMQNSVFLTLAFLVISLLFVGLGKVLSRNT